MCQDIYKAPRIFTRPPFERERHTESLRVWRNKTIKLDNSARMRTPAFIATLRRLTQSKDVLLQTQPEKGKVTARTDFLLIMCQGTWSRLNPCRKAIESLDSYFDRAEIEPGAHYFNAQGNQTDRHQSHFRKGR